MVYPTVREHNPDSSGSPPGRGCLYSLPQFPSQGDQKAASPRGWFPFLLRYSLAILLIGSGGCAHPWCVPVVSLEEEVPIIRGQSPEEVDPAFAGSRPSAQPVSAPPIMEEPPQNANSSGSDSQITPMAGREPATLRQSTPRQSAQLESPPALGNSVLDKDIRPVYRASPLTAADVEGERLSPDEPIYDVRIEGNATIPVAAMSSYIKTRPGRPTTEDQVREDVRSLYNTKWFFSIEPVYRRQAEGLVLIFKVTERPILKRVEYDGNEKVKDHVLAGITGLKPTHAFSVATNREAVRRIQEYYLEKGYMHAEVTLAEGGDPEDRSVVFKIKEGPLVRVNSITFVGNKDVESGVLRLRLETKKRILWKFGGKYDPVTIPGDVAALKQYYHNIGYFDVEVGEEVKFSDDKALVDVTYTINEGLRYKIREITLKGNQIFSREQLLGEFKTTPDKYYSARELAQDISSVQSKYGELGRLFAKVNTSTVFTKEPGIVDLAINIDEDRVYKIGMINVHIRGDHSHTKETVALNQMLLAPGELADPEKIRRTKARFAGAATWEAGGPMAPEINVRPVMNPTYLAKTANPNPPTIRAANDYFGPDFDEQFPKPLGNLSVLKGTPYASEVEQPASMASQETSPQKQTEFIPTTLRQERLPTGQTPIRNTQSQSAPSQEVIPGAGHSYRPWNLPGAETSTPAQTQSQSPPATDSVVPNSSYYREERKDRPAEESTLLYQPLDFDQTSLFHDRPDPFLSTTIPAGVENGPPVIRAQNYDNYTRPPNLMYNETPQGDLLGPQLQSPVMPPGYVDLDVNLSEARTGRFMVGAGVNSDSGVVGNIVLEEQNFDIMRFPTSFRDVVDGYAFRGGGQQFRLEATPGSEVSRYLVSWTDPYFLDTDYSLGLSGFYYQRYFRDWSEQRTGGRVNVGKLLTRELSFNTALRLEQVDISNPRLAPGMAPSIDAIVGDNFLGTGRFSLGYDTRDSSYMATEGFNLTGSVEQAFADYDFTKLELQASQYYTVYQRPDGAGKHVLSFRGNLGWTTDDTPAFERFYAGGFQTFRGFEFRSVTPLEPGNLGTNGAAVGGFFQMLGTAEYMLPVMANEAVRVVAFSDFGTVDEDVTLDSFRVSVGAGLRITVPQMGPVPIALDWAFPVVKEETDIRQVFSFYIGLTR